jgi:hypothetical protein
MKRLACLVLVPLLAAPLAGCGSDRREEDLLMRRVAQAEEAAKKAEAAAARAEDAARAATGGSTVPETVYEEAPESEDRYGEGADPAPLDG